MTYLRSRVWHFQYHYAMLANNIKPFSLTGLSTVNSGQLLSIGARVIC